MRIPSNHCPRTLGRYTPADPLRSSCHDLTAQGGFLGRERIQLFDESRYFFVDRRQKRINAELMHASGSMFGDVLEFQKIRLR